MEISDYLGLLGGLAMFLYGMRMMSKRAIEGACKIGKIGKIGKNRRFVPRFPSCHRIYDSEKRDASQTLRRNISSQFSISGTKLA